MTRLYLSIPNLNLGKQAEHRGGPASAHSATAAQTLISLSKSISRKTGEAASLMRQTFCAVGEKSAAGKTYAESVIEFAKANQNINLSDMAYTLQTGRDAMDYRLAVTAGSREELISRLTDFVNGNTGEGIYETHIKTAKKKSKHLKRTMI